MSKKQKHHQMIVPGNAIAVRIPVAEDFALAMKIWKRKVKTSDVLNHVKSNKEYIKPSVQKRMQTQRAKYIQQIKDLQYK
jgi:ribosomal protein S21